MPQWNPRSLLVLICTFSGFLLVFNLLASFVGKISHFIPFSKRSSSFYLSTENMERGNFPVSIVFLSTNQSVLTDPNIKMNIFCGDVPFFTNHSYRLSNPFKLGMRSYCPKFEIFIVPPLPRVALYLKSFNPTLNYTLLGLRAAFVIIVFFSFYNFFLLGKNLSVMRSILVIQMCVILMLDPFLYFSYIFPTLSNLHILLFGFGWWRCSCELFSEYAPLVRQKVKVFKLTNVIPIFCFVMMNFFRNYRLIPFKIFLNVLSIFAGIVLPIIGFWFIFKAGNTTGRSALVIHILSGTLTLTVVYYVKIISLTYDSFSDSFLSHSIEISFLGAYAMFQTVFQTGESSDESEQHLPHQQNSGKYEKIEELLESLTNMEDSVKFEIPE